MFDRDRIDWGSTGISVKITRFGFCEDINKCVGCRVSELSIHLTKFLLNDRTSFVGHCMQRCPSGPLPFVRNFRGVTVPDGWYVKVFSYSLELHFKSRRCSIPNMTEISWFTTST